LFPAPPPGRKEERRRKEGRKAVKDRRKKGRKVIRDPPSLETKKFSGLYKLRKAPFFTVSMTRGSRSINNARGM
jgi:hypothetical protein